MALSFDLPDLDFCGVISSGEYRDALCEISGVIGLDSEIVDEFAQAIVPYEGREDTDIRHELRVEYTRLFVGAPVPPLPFSEGVWRAKERGEKERLLIVNDDTMAIEAFMKACGIFAIKRNQEAIDNIYTECEFMQYLLLTDTFPDDFEYTPDQAYEKFFHEHMEDWIPAFCDQVVEMTELDFYRGLAKTLKSFILLQSENYK